MEGRKEGTNRLLQRDGRKRGEEAWRGMRARDRMRRGRRQNIEGFFRCSLADQSQTRCHDLSTDTIYVRISDLPAPI